MILTSDLKISISVSPLACDLIAPPWNSGACIFTYYYVLRVTIMGVVNRVRPSQVATHRRTLFAVSECMRHILSFTSRPCQTMRSVLPTLEHSLSVGRAAVLETGQFAAALGHRTTSLEQSATVPPNLRLYVGYGQFRRGYRRHLYSDLTAPNRNILTYLFTISCYLYKKWYCVDRLALTSTSAVFFRGAF